MNVRASGDKVVAWVLWPSALLHEATHVLPLLPWLESVDVDLRSNAQVRCDVQPGTPAWAIRLAAILPTVIGTLVAAAVYLTVIATGGGTYVITIQPGLLIEWGFEPVAWALGTAWWYWYTIPSEDDRSRFQNPIPES